MWDVNRIEAKLSRNLQCWGAVGDPGGGKYKDRRAHLVTTVQLLAGGLRKQVLEYGLQGPHLALTADFLCGELKFIGLTKQGSAMEHTVLNSATDQPGKLF